jgi:uncharacterized LabA/DUF88 family protein
VQKAYLFIGFVGYNTDLYTKLQTDGYICIFKPTLEIKDKITKTTKVKGNVDAELVLHTMIEKDKFDKAVIVSGDGDFTCLIKHLNSINKLDRVISATPWNTSSLIKHAGSGIKITFLHSSKEKLAKKK